MQVRHDSKKNIPYNETILKGVYVMSKISDMIVSAILKRGTLGEFKNFKTEVEIPQENKELIRITIQAESLQIRVEKGEE